MTTNRDVWKGCGRWTDTGLSETVEAERDAFEEDMRERNDALSGQ